MDQPLLSVRNLKTFFLMDEGTVKAVDGVSFDVQPGQVVGIVGESGCGKSVTIKSVLRIVQKPGQIVGGEILFRRQRRDGRGRQDGPDAGTEIVDLATLDAYGHEMRAIRGSEIALIPQEPMAAMSPVHTIGNQLVEALRLHQDVGKAEAERIVIGRMREVGIPSPAERMTMYPWELSGGLRQRVMIAMALSCHPKLLIADEPTTAIDVTTQAQVLSLLRSLQQQHGMAIIFITHDLGVIAQIADFVVVMYLGRVMETGPVDDIFHRPQHPYTRALLESIPTMYARSKALLPTIVGSIPHPFNRPAGCPFYPRCSDYMAGTCDRALPALRADQRAAGRELLSLPQRRGRGLRMPADATLADKPPILEVRNLQEVLPDQEGHAAQGRGPGARGRRCELRARRGRDAGPGRRERLRQDHDRALHPARPRSLRRPDPVPHQGGRGGRRRGAARARGAPFAARDADDLPGPLRLAQPAHEPSGHRRRAAPGDRPDDRSRASAPSGSRTCCAWSACARSTCGASRMRSAAASGSGS